MYEMKGALSASPHQASQWPGLAGAARRPPGPGTRTNHRFPGYSRVPGMIPGWCLFPTVKTFLRLFVKSCKSLREFTCSFFPVHTVVHIIQQVIRIPQLLSTAYTQPVHRLPGVTLGIRLKRRRR